MGVGGGRCETCVAWGWVGVGRECANLFPGTICRTKCQVRCRKLGGVAARCGSSHSSKGGLRRERSATTSGLYLRSRAWARMRAGGQDWGRNGAGLGWVWIGWRVWEWVVCGAGVGRVSGWVWGALPRIDMHKHAVIHPALPIKKDCRCSRQRERMGGRRRAGRVRAAWAWLRV